MSGEVKKRYKIVVYVPKEHGEEVREAMGSAGAGHIGHQSFCTFTSIGISRFKPNDGMHPEGEGIGKLEAVEEERIETVCPEEKVQDVVNAVRAVHPYESPAIDVHPLETVA